MKKPLFFHLIRTLDGDISPVLSDESRKKFLKTTRLDPGEQIISSIPLRSSELHGGLDVDHLRALLALEVFQEGAIYDLLRSIFELGYEAGKKHGS